MPASWMSAKSVTLSAGTLAMNNDTLVGGTLVLSAGTVLWAGGELDNTILDGTLNLSASGASGRARRHVRRSPARRAQAAAW